MSAAMSAKCCSPGPKSSFDIISKMGLGTLPPSSSVARTRSSTPDLSVTAERKFETPSFQTWVSSLLLADGQPARKDKSDHKIMLLHGQLRNSASISRNHGFDGKRCDSKHADACIETQTSMPPRACMYGLDTKLLTSQHRCGAET